MSDQNASNSDERIAELEAEIETLKKRNKHVKEIHQEELRRVYEDNKHLASQLQRVRNDVRTLREMVPVEQEDEKEKKYKDFKITQRITEISNDLLSKLSSSN